MRSREDVVALFRDKYAYLQMVCQRRIGPFDESAIYQNPEGGWQLNLEQPGTDYKAAITLCPNDDVPHDTHGIIGARWFQEGGAFDVNGIPGRLGYPIADENEETVFVNLPSLRGPHDTVRETRIWNSTTIAVSSACSQFEFGRIEFRRGITWDSATENIDYNALRCYLDAYEGNYWIGDIYGIPVCRPPVNLHSDSPVTGEDLLALFRNSHSDYDDDVFVISPSLSVTLN